MQADFNGFTLNDYFFIQSKLFQGRNLAVSAFDVPNGVFHKIKIESEFLFIFGACHVTFEEENLVLKIGGYRARKLFAFDNNPALNTTTILQFSKPLLEFSVYSDLQVICFIK